MGDPNNHCNFREFIERVLYSLSGVKIISSIVASLLIFLIVWAKHKWPELSEPIALAGIEAIKFLCAGLLFTNAALSAFDIFKGKPFNQNGQDGASLEGRQ